MTILEVSTAIGCPVLCRWCPQTLINSVYHGPRLMTLDLFKTCLAHMPAGVPLSFAGYAEPFLNNHAIDMMEHASPLHSIEVYSTGVGVTRRDIEGLKRVRPKALTLHLADAEGHARIRCDAAYVATVTELADSLPNVNAMTMGTLPDALVPRFGKLIPHPMHSRAGNVPGMAVLTKRGPLKCSAAPDLDHPVLIPDGNLILCCMDYGLVHPMGNLYEKTWEEIRAGQSLAAMRRSMATGDGILCRKCEYAVPA